MSCCQLLTNKKSFYTFENATGIILLNASETNNTIMTQKLLLIATLIAVQLLWVSGQAPDTVGFYGLNVFNIQQYNSSGAFVGFITPSCRIDNSTFATVGGDGKIWSSFDTSLQYFDPETNECGNIDVGGFVNSAVASPSGKHIYFVYSGGIYRYNLRLKTSQFVLPGNRPYSAIGFVGSSLLASRQPNITIEIYNTDQNDDIVLPAASVVQFNDNYYSALKIRTCPGGQIYCFMFNIYTNMIGRKNVNGYLQRIVSYSQYPNIQQIFDYFTAPWGQMYVLGSGQILSVYSWNQTSASLHLDSSQSYVYPTTSASSMVPLMAAPSVSIGNDCKASVQFSSYSWTSKITVQVVNPTTGLFEDDTVQSSPAAGSQNVQLTAVCDGATMRVRVRYDGLPSTDPAYSLPKTVNCACQAPVPNIIPILECIEQTSTGLVVHLGYNNTESYVAQLAVGPSNRFSDVDDRNQTTSFAVGRSNFYPASAFSFAYSGTTTWFLSNYALSIDTSDTRLMCPQNVSFSLSFTSSTDVTSQDIEAIRQSLVTLLNITSDRVNVVNVTSTPVTKKRATNIVQLVIEITATQNPNELSASEAVRTIVNLVDQSPSTLNQIVNAGGSGRAVQSVNTVPTGVQQQGTNTNPSASPAGSDSPSSVPQTTSQPHNHVTSSSFITLPNIIVVSVALLLQFN